MIDKTTQKYIKIKADEFVTQCPWFSLRKASRVATQLSNTFLQDSGLLITQLCVLVVIARLEDATYKQLAEDLVMDPTTLSRNLKPLERQGLIGIRTGEEDARTKLVSLTEEGETVLARALPLWESAKAEITAIFGSENVVSLLQMVATLSEIAPENPEFS